MAKSTAVDRRLIGLFWLVAATSLMPFVLLAFLNDMAADDFLYRSLFRQYGFFGGQRWIYLNWAGRYTTSFLNGSFAASGLLTRAYWLPCLLLLAGAWLAMAFLVRSFCVLLPAQPAVAVRSRTAAISLVLFILLLYAQADIATGIYWFCSAIVYQTSLILFLLLAGGLMRRLIRTDRAQGLDVLLLLLIILIVGCNEMSAVFLLFFLAAVSGAHAYIRRHVPAWLWVYLCAALVTGLVVALTSGVLRVRSATMIGHSSYPGILAAIGFQFVYALFSILKEPLFWFSVSAAFHFGVRISREDKDLGWMAVFRERSVFLRGLGLLLLVVALSLATVMTVSRGSLPPRALNNLTGLLTIGLLILSLLAGVRKGGGIQGYEGPLPSAAVPVAVLTLLLVASTNYRDAWKTVFAGYFVHAVAQDRDRQLTDAGKRHQHIVTLLSYPDAIGDKIHEMFPRGLPETAHELILQRPPLMLPYDGTAAENRKGYCIYYGIDSIIVGRH